MKKTLNQERDYRIIADNASIKFVYHAKIFSFQLLSSPLIQPQYLRNNIR